MLHPGASLIELRAVSHAVSTGAPLSEITLDFAPGSFTVFRGETGAGTRELWRVLTLVEPPQAGSIVVEGEPAEHWPDDRRAEYRARRFGFVLSAPFLLPALTVVENVAMPIFKKNLPEITPQAAGERARALLDFAGMGGVAEVMAGHLHPLEQHRVSLARALANEPAVLFVEELDSALPPDALPETLALLRTFAAENPVAVIGTASAAFGGTPGVRVLTLAQGALHSESALASAPFN